MDREGGKISGPSCMHSLGSNKFLILRSTNLLEIVGPGAEDSLFVDDKPMASTCVDHQRNNQMAITTMAYLSPDHEPYVNVWIKNLG